jgi:AcrR family transcriptional regulator
MERGDKREAIIHAALEIVAEHGFHGAPMAMIAERAGVGAGTIYRYFENKDILITEVFSDLEGRFLAAVMENYPADQPIRQRFLHIASVIVRYCVNAPLDFRFLEQFHNSPYGTAHRRDKLFGRRENDIVRDLFEEGLANGIVKDLPLPILFSLSFGPLISIARDAILAFIDLDDQMISKAVEACWDAVKA